MAFTSHGKFVPGSSPKNFPMDIRNIKDCEGPGLCAACTAECVRITGEPVEGYIYPAFVAEDKFLLKLVGIARVDQENGRVVVSYSPTEKEPNAEQEVPGSEDRGSTDDRVAYDVRSRQLGFGR